MRVHADATTRGRNIDLLAFPFGDRLSASSAVHSHTLPPGGDVASSTLTINADTTECEAALERCIELAEGFREVWGDAPLPVAIESLDVRPGDTLVLRHDKDLDPDEIAHIKASVEGIFKGVTVAVLSGGLGVETVVRPAETR